MLLKSSFMHKIIPTFLLCLFVFPVFAQEVELKDLQKEIQEVSKKLDRMEKNVFAAIFGGGKENIPAIDPE